MRTSKPKRQLLTRLIQIFELKNNFFNLRFEIGQAKD